MREPIDDPAGTDLAALVEEHRLNAALAWAASGALLVLAGLALATGDLTWGTFVLAVTVVSALPGPFYRSLATTLPWELVALLAATVGWRTLSPTSELALYAATAGTAVLVAAEVQLFSRARLGHRFVVVLVAVATAAVAGVWALLSWAADWYLGTDYITTNAELMGDLAAASVSGVLAGAVFDGYVRWWEARLDRLTPLLDDRGG